MCASELQWPWEYRATARGVPVARPIGGERVRRESDLLDLLEEGDAHGPLLAKNQYQVSHNVSPSVRGGSRLYFRTTTTTMGDAVPAMPAFASRASRPAASRFHGQAVPRGNGPPAHAERPIPIYPTLPP